MTVVYKLAPEMDDSPERAFLGAARGPGSLKANQVDVEVSLVLLAGQGVDLDEDELPRSPPRAPFSCLATGRRSSSRASIRTGRAVTALAEPTSNAPERRAALAVRASHRSAPAVEGLPHVSARLERLADDEALAWRWFCLHAAGREVLVEGPLGRIPRFQADRDSDFATVSADVGSGQAQPTSCRGVLRAPPTDRQSAVIAAVVACTCAGIRVADDQRATRRTCAWP